MTSSAYSRPPHAHHGAIPLFSRPTEYTENYEQISADHLQSVRSGKGNPFMEEGYWQEIESSTELLIRKYSQPGQRILDVGVGLGRLLERFPEWDRYGVDISLGYLEEAKAKGIEVCYALIEELPYQDESFEVITCTDVLEHVLDLTACSRKIIAALKPGGYFIVRVPYRENLSWYASPDCTYKFVHVRNFDEDSLRLHFTKILGLEAVEFTTVGLAAGVNLLRWPSPFGLWNRAFCKLCRFCLKRGIFRSGIKKFFHATEINYVFRKPKS